MSAPHTLRVFVIFLFFSITLASPFTYVLFDASLDSKIASRLSELLEQSSPYPLSVLSPTWQLNYTSLEPGSFVLSFGNTSVTNSLISENDLSKLKPESYIIRSSQSSEVLIVVTHGTPQKSLDPFVVYANIGLHYGCYGLLRELGYGFLHPLQRIIPKRFVNPSSSLNITESPQWEIRAWHYHTEHPLEITEFLNGMDSGTTVWYDMIDELAQYAEWLVANRQNRLEYVLLWEEAWDEFAWSSTRQTRLTQICDLLHQWGLAIGADVPIAEKQQHAWYMTDSRITTEEQFANISRHIDWLMVAGYDFISTESGFSEFTHPNCTLMLTWMNYATNYLLSEYQGKRIYIKCHCSSGQICPEYSNPYTNEPLNFNFLPAYATPDLGIYPHTVQIYNLTEPAPTYGNQNFTYMLEFLVQECGKREVVFHGESAYWVNYDINVPLFLPIYGANRINDMRTVYSSTSAANRAAQGQANFESGWEWSYWLGNAMTAYAAWNPKLHVSFDQAVEEILLDLLKDFGSSSTVQSLVDMLMDIIKIESQLLVYGNWNGTAPSDVHLRNGMAYLAGWDTWAQWENFVDPKTLTQPSKLTFHNLRSPLNILTPENLPDYETEIQPLLYTMQLNFSSALDKFSQLQPQINPSAMGFYQELLDTLNITTQRAVQVYSLYQYVWGKHRHSGSWSKEQISNANVAISKAQEIVTERESNYRVPVERIASWRSNPTAYAYTYLWTAHSLYYFWRDYSQATTYTMETITPCFMNVQTPADVGFGQGILLNVSYALENWLNSHGLTGIGECLTAPQQEPIYPLTPIIDG